jgi:predicted dehydrogenase/nucleoside-diphosphate-sugar epimerase
MSVTAELKKHPLQFATDKKIKSGDLPLRIGLIGCGKIAEYHARFITTTTGAQLVGIADSNDVVARELAQKYSVKQVYSSHADLFNACALDVVHILTPPRFHYMQAMDAVERGVHVLLEKPCTLHPDDLQNLYERAEAKGILLCPDFIQLFSPPYLEGLAVVDSGQLGKIVHINVHLSVDLNEPELREAMGLHWSYKLPGGILHNNITHVLYLALHRLGAPKNIFVVPEAHGTMPQQVTDHLNILLVGKNCTANIVLTGATKPEPYYVHIFCERGNVLIDFDTSTVLTTKMDGLPRFLRRASANFQRSYRLSSVGMRNIVNYLRGRLVPYQGLKNLLPAFYSCVRSGAELPISKELALLVAKAEQCVFERSGKLHIDDRRKPSTQTRITRTEKILVTGASGYLGSTVVRKLVAEGYYVRALVRRLSHTTHLEKVGVELVYGDIRNFDSVSDASNGMDIVVHLAAALRGNAEYMLDCAVQGTRNVDEAAKVAGVKRVIYISSMAVYDYLKLQDGEVISEESPLEEHPELRGSYSIAKRHAENEALSRLDQECPSWTILRPSVIVGHHSDLFSPIGIKVGGVVLCFGGPGKILRLIHVEDVATAICKIVENNATRGHVFNLSNARILQGEYIQKCVRKRNKYIRVVFVPYWVASFAGWTLEGFHKLSHRVPNIDRRRLAYLYRNLEANSAALMKETGWRPRDNLVESLAAEAENVRQSLGIA